MAAKLKNNSDTGSDSATAGVNVTTLTSKGAALKVLLGPKGPTFVAGDNQVDHHVPIADAGWELAEHLFLIEKRSCVGGWSSHQTLLQASVRGRALHFGHLFALAWCIWLRAASTTSPIRDCGRRSATAVLFQHRPCCFLVLGFLLLASSCSCFFFVFAF